ncbi:MAG: (2Fe-2S) ferredoxin domain-containing protein [Nannocystis sp.]|nr:(2Fe-2S) ferredoxin domain-containing protein [Nannocystis sp.]
MKQPQQLLFVCQNLRDAADPRGSCMARGSREVLERLKRCRAELGAQEAVRVMGSTCQGACESGITVLAVDDAGARFYGRMTPALAESLLRARAAGTAEEPALALRRLPRADLLDLSALEGEGGELQATQATQETQGREGEGA